MNILKKIFGTKNARDLKRLRPIVAEINRIEAEYQAKNFTAEDFPRMTAPAATSWAPQRRSVATRSPGT